MARFENEKKAAEQELARSRDLRVQVATFSQTETELRSQLNVYVEKFKQVSRDVLFIRVKWRVWNELRSETELVLSFSTLCLGMPSPERSRAPSVICRRLLHVPLWCRTILRP